MMKWSGGWMVLHHTHIRPLDHVDNIIQLTAITDGPSVIGKSLARKSQFGRIKQAVS